MYAWRKLQQALTGTGNMPAAVAPKVLEPGVLMPLPEDAIALVPMRSMVMFPGVIAPVTIGRQRSVAAAQESARSERKLGFLLQREAGEIDPKQDDLHWVGTAGQVLRYVTGAEGAHHLVVQGQSRFRVLEFLEGWPFLVGRVQYVEESQATGACPVSLYDGASIAKLLEDTDVAVQRSNIMVAYPDFELFDALKGV